MHLTCRNMRSVHFLMSYVTYIHDWNNESISKFGLEKFWEIQAWMDMRKAVLSKHSHINTWRLLRVKQSESENDCLSSSSAETHNSILLPSHFYGGMVIQTSVALSAMLTGAVLILISLSNIISGDYILIGHDHLHSWRHLCPLIQGVSRL